MARSVNWMATAHPLSVVRTAPECDFWKLRVAPSSGQHTQIDAADAEYVEVRAKNESLRSYTYFTFPTSDVPYASAHSARS